MADLIIKGEPDWHVKVNTMYTENHDKLGVLSTDVESHSTQLSEIVQEPYHLNVGVNQKYKTINEAWNEYLNPLTINMQPTVIHIYKGVYKEKIIKYGKVNVSFIGEDKNLVTWKTTSGYYADAPIAIQGNVLLKGITFIADHTENPSYTWVTETTGAYAVHIVGDNGLGGSKITIEDCILRSYQNSGLGSGTGDNHTIEVINSEIYNHSDVSIGGTSLSSGALLYHSSSANGLNQKLKLKNVKIHSDNGHAITLQTYGDNDDIINLECTNVVCSSNVVANNSQMVKFYPDNSNKYRIVLTKNSCFNNASNLNNTDGTNPITAVDGDATIVSDFNNAKWFSLSRGSAGLCLNLPTESTYLAITYPYMNGTTTAYNYSIQYAWAVLNGFKKYKRTQIGGVWNAWVECFEEKYIENNIVGNSSTDFNNVTTAKFYGTSTTGCLNTPNANGFNNGFYVGEEISYSATYRLQYAWAIQDSYKKYKRSKTSTTWTNWVLVNE